MATPVVSSDTDASGGRTLSTGTFASGETSAVFRDPGGPSLTIQAVGAGTVTIEGSLDGTNFGALKDPLGVAISLANSLLPAQIGTRCPYYRVKCAASGSTTAKLYAPAY